MGEPEELCGTLRKTGERCARPAGWGTSRGIGECRNHGGTSPTHEIHAAREMVRRRGFATTGSRWTSNPPRRSCRR